jgi:hypothetical protein
MNGGYSWDITFNGATVEADVPLLTVVDNTLSGTNAFVHVEQTTPGNVIGGFYQICFPPWYPAVAECTPDISSFADHLGVASALKAMDEIDAGGVTVTQTNVDAYNGRTFQISFAPYIGTAPNGKIPKYARDMSEVYVKTSKMTGVNVVAAVATVQDGTWPVSNEYNKKGWRLVTPGGSQTYPLSQHTRWLTNDETAESMRQAVEDAGGLPAGFAVERTGPFDDGGYEWEFILPKGTTLNGNTMWVVNHGGADAQLWPTTATVVAQLSRLSTLPLAGQFKLAYNGRPTGLLDVDATAAEVRDALLALTGVGDLGDVIVSTHSIDFAETASGARRWDVTFSSLQEAGDVPDLTADFSAITQGTNANPVITEERKGESNVVQLVTVNKAATSFCVGCDETFSFSLGFKSTAAGGGSDSYYYTTQLNFGASADEVQEALAKVHYNQNYGADEKRTHGPGGVVVERFGDASSEFRYYILFTDNNDDANVNELLKVKNKAWCSAAQSTLCDDPEYDATLHKASTVTPLSGTFQLGYGDSCYEQVESKHGKERAEVICNAAPMTVSLNYDATAREVEDALEALPAIVDVVVTRTNDNNDLQEHKLPMTSGIVSTNYNYYIHFREVYLNMSSAISETYFEGGERDEFLWAAGDIPLVKIDGSSLGGTATYDQACVLGSPNTQAAVSCQNYNIRAFEIVKGVNQNIGGVVNVEVSQNGGVDFNSNNPRTTAFKYLPVARVTGLQPDHGPISGFTEVIVYGNNFKQSSLLSCRFGTSEASGNTKNAYYVVPAAQWFNDTCIMCLSPKALKAGDVWVEVSNNGGGGFANFSTSNTLGRNLQTVSTKFTYTEALSIKSFEPASGPISGNFSVTIFGGPFVKTDELRCRFGDKTTIGVYLDSNSLQCYTPYFDVPTTTVLEVSNNDQDYTNQRLSFNFYQDIRLSRIMPVNGPAVHSGTVVSVYGDNFRNTSATLCRFGLVEVPALFVSSHQVKCETPPLHPDSGGLRWLALSEQYNRYPDPVHGDTKLFPSAHYYPLYNSRLVAVEVTNNAQDYSDSGITFLYQEDAEVFSVHNDYGPYSGNTPIFVHGNNFVNSTLLSCRIGGAIVEAIYMDSHNLLCFTPSRSSIESRNNYLSHGQIKSESFPHSQDYKIRPDGADTNVVYVEISNNKADFTMDRNTYTYTEGVAPGKYLPGADDLTVLDCPRGAFCPGRGLSNFTLCPRGTYQPLKSQPSCLRCPVGYMCPEEGLPVPRICPAGFVCDVTGIETADQPCPEGHFCRQGTATTSTTCGHPVSSAQLFPSLTQAERPRTLRKGRDASGFDFLLGARNSACWNNMTSDFGLQLSTMPARIWAERHLLPLNEENAFNPIRGRYCLDDTCMKLEDSDDLTVTDVSFDYSSQGFALRRPVPCPEGMYCHAGTAVNMSRIDDYTTPQPCSESMYCPEGSVDPQGQGGCPRGFYCPFATKIPCPIGTYCPRDGHWDPMPCPPGTFNAMVGQLKCAECPLGYICPGFGRLQPAACPPGFSCGNEGLTSPNARCPPGFFCPSGTITSDPFRNDTTLRPYPCAPGSYCLGGVGYDEVKSGDFLYSQPCTDGFYCELASVGPKGSGLCPAGFICPSGTSSPIPTPKGYFASSKGTVQAAACLPGYYAPTIQTEECYPCPPGTLCEVDGLYEAEICPPGTYRSTLAADGLPCAACPQGTWSKNWQMREQGECTRCPTGVVCPVEGMTQPCGKSDLPLPFEPVVNLNGLPVPEFDYPNYDIPPSFSLYECLKMNPGYTERTIDPFYQVFFYGELVPPYIDVLGRGAHFRSSSPNSLLYQPTAKCYKNTQRYGSILYQRVSDYYGPQYDIQTGFSHQGYGDKATYNQVYGDAPPLNLEDMSEKDTVKYFHGDGTVYIDLPHARIFEPTFNCTPGFQIMNETLNPRPERIVYTDSFVDPGGYDLEKCPIWDNSTDLNCYVDSDGNCCNIPSGVQRAIALADDQFYPGTCESDVICKDDLMGEAESCSQGYVCDEMTTTAGKNDYICREGYYCDFGTTPDPDLEAPRGQFAKMCPKSHFCPDGTGLGQAYLNLCPENFFCPTGTGNPYIGSIANDAINRGISADLSNPNLGMINLKYLGDDDVRVIGDHESRCFSGVDSELMRRSDKNWRAVGQDLNNPHLTFLRELKDVNEYQNSTFLPPYNTESSEEIEGKPDGAYRPYIVNRAVKNALTCSRDNKWKLTEDSIAGKECDCIQQMLVVASVYRLWKCSATKEMDDLGLASVNSAYTAGNMQVSDPFGNNFKGGRDFWFDRYHLSKEFALAMDETLEGKGLKWSVDDGHVCEWDLRVPGDNGLFGLKHGKIPVHGDTSRYYDPPIKNSFPFDNFLYNETSNKVYLDLAGQQVGFTVQFTWMSTVTFSNYQELKDAVHLEYVSELDAMSYKPNGLRNREDIDPYIYDLNYAVRLVEEFGDRLPEIVYFRERDINDLQGVGALKMSKEGKDNWDAPDLFRDDGKNTLDVVPGRLDSCGCQNLFKCPNGTKSFIKADSVEDCVIPDIPEVLRRISAIPVWYWKSMNESYGEFGASKFEEFNEFKLHGKVFDENNPVKYMNGTDYNDVGNIYESGDSIGTLKMTTGEVAVYTFNLTGMPNNFTYNEHYRISAYKDCKPCPNRYVCSYDDEPEGTCADFPSSDVQFENFNKCLLTERKTVCVTNETKTAVLGEEGVGGCLDTKAMYDSGYYPLSHPNSLIDPNTKLPVITAIPQSEIDTFYSTFLVYDEPDLFKCLNTPYFCDEQEWPYMTWRRICKDDPDPENLDYYNCKEFELWKNFERWAHLQCSIYDNLDYDPLSGLCLESGWAIVVNPNNIYLENFKAEFDYLPTPAQFLKPPQGIFVMDSDIQESFGVGDFPSDRFDRWHKNFGADTNADGEATFTELGLEEEWKAFLQVVPGFQQIELIVGNMPLVSLGILRIYNSQEVVDISYENTNWMKTDGCCACQPHDMPEFFMRNVGDTGRKDNGFEDNKHQFVQFTAMALHDLDLTVVIELLHGKYYVDFDDYFGGFDMTEFHLHTPQRFEYSDSKSTTNMWLAVLEKSMFDGTDNPTTLELPLNLPIKNEFVSMENSLLLSRPSAIAIGDKEYYEKVSERKQQVEQIKLYSKWVEMTGGLGNFTNVTNLMVKPIDYEGREAEMKNDPYPVKDPYEVVGISNLWWNDGDPTLWGPDNKFSEFSFLSLPYFPYFSNCDGYDSYMSISKLIEEHPECTQYAYDDTRYVSPYPWHGLMTPLSDNCEKDLSESERIDPVTGEIVDFRTRKGIDIVCNFEESVETATGGFRWYEADADTILYRMTKYPSPLKTWLEADVEEDSGMIMERWGRRSSVEAIIPTYFLVPVKVHEERPGTRNAIPLDVRFRVQYYQQAKGLKTLVSGEMIYNNLCTTVKPAVFGGNQAILNAMRDIGYFPCDVDITGALVSYEYNLEFHFHALDWFELLNRFEFESIIYIAFFTLVGIMSIMNAALIWSVNRLLTKLRHPPTFHAMTLVSIVMDAPVFGCSLAAIPYLFTFYFVKRWFASPVDGGFFSLEDPTAASSMISDLAFESFAGDWQDGMALTLDRIEMYRTGRTGTALLAIGLYTTILSASLIVPEWMDEHQEDNQGADPIGGDNLDDEDEEPMEKSPVWTPIMWKRSHLIWGSLCLEMFLMIIWEFSYSSIFETYVYTFIMVFKIIQMLMDVVMGDLLREHLMNAPLVVIIEVSEILVTMGASDFMDFTFSYFVELSVMIMERLYLDPALKTLTKYWPKWRMQLIRKFAKRKRLTRAQKQAEEMEWRRIIEDIELESEGIEPLLDSYSVYSVEVTGGICALFVNLFLMDYYQLTQMPVNYGIRQNEMVFYTIFAGYLIPYSFLMDMFILNSQELIHGWKVYDYVSYQKYRFSTREKRWMLMSETLDESIAEGMQTLDLMCFSSQYYFLLALFALGMLNNMFAITIFLRSQYNVFGDPVMPMIMMLTFLLCEGVKRFLLYCADVQIRYFGWRGLWKTKQIEGTVDDDVAAKLAIGEGRQADLEQERLELQALNSERFRHRFLERNRPWILQHLVELLTPRSLDSIGHDGRPVVEYIRDVYAELMAMGEGARKPGDKSDISSDEEDELEDMRRAWPRKPLEGASLAMARLWLEKARKRRAFSKLVSGIIQSHKEAACSVCSRTEDSGALLSVGLANNGEFDQYAIDRLIADFEKHYSVNEKDPNLWKAFFRSKAQYITRCNFCLDKMEQERLKREAKLPGAGRTTRPDDISSDESDEEVVFDQVFVTGASNEGKMMHKWLGAARKRIGGVFPRPDARKQMERHAEKMRKRKLDGGKDKIAGMENIDKEGEERAKKWEVELTAASKALAIRWLRQGRDSVSKKFRQRGEELREQVLNFTERMPEEDDWFFGAALRIDGLNLKEEGSQLMLDRRSLEADEAVKIRKIEIDYNDFEKEKQKIIDEDRRAFEQKMAEAADRVQIEVELRTRELNRLMEERKGDNEAAEKLAREEEGAVSSEMMEAHRNSIIELEELIANESTRAEMAHSKTEQAERAVFDRKELLMIQTVTDRRILAADNVQRIKRETMSKIKADETAYQSRSARWLGIAQRKVTLKEQEDAENAVVARRKKRRG